MGLELRGPCCQITAFVGEDYYAPALINYLCWLFTMTILFLLPQQWLCWPTTLSSALTLPPSPILMLPVNIIIFSPFQAQTVDERTCCSIILYFQLWTFYGFVISIVIIDSSNLYFIIIFSSVFFYQIKKLYPTLL